MGQVQQGPIFGFFEADVELERGAQSRRKEADWIQEIKLKFTDIADRAYFNEGSSFNEEKAEGKNWYIGKRKRNGQTVYFADYRPNSSRETVEEHDFGELQMLWDFCQQRIVGNDRED